MPDVAYTDQREEWIAMNIGPYFDTEDVPSLDQVARAAFDAGAITTCPDPSQYNRLREAATEAFQWLDSETDNATETAINADRAAGILQNALYPQRK